MTGQPVSKDMSGCICWPGQVRAGYLASGGNLRERRNPRGGACWAGRRGRSSSLPSIRNIYSIYYVNGHIPVNLWVYIYYAVNGIYSY